MIQFRRPANFKANLAEYFRAFDSMSHCNLHDDGIAQAIGSSVTDPLPTIHSEFRFLVWKTAHSTLVSLAGSAPAALGMSETHGARSETSFRHAAFIHARAVRFLSARYFFKFGLLANQCEIVAAHLGLKLKIL